MTRATLIRGGRVIDPATGRDGSFDVLLEEGRVSRVDAQVAPTPLAEVVDAAGLWVVPGLVDLRCRVGATKDLEDAARGGFTTLVATWDSVTLPTPLRVLRASPLTRAAEGEELGDVPAGTPCLSDGSSPVVRAGLMRRALQYARPLGVPLMVHALDPSLAGRGVLGEGFEATRLGLLPVPASAEVTMVARDLALLEESGGRLHFAHLTCAASVRLVREAKSRGLKVTCDVAAHHLALCDEDARGYARKARVWPPLRPRPDQLALRAALAEGVLDAVTSDHARPDPDEDPLQRELPFDEAAPGAASLPRVAGIVLGLGLPPSRAVAALTSGPAAALGLGAGRLAPGDAADVALIDPAGGHVVRTIAGGRLVYSRTGG